jgi:hypothetical protein
MGYRADQFPEILRRCLGACLAELKPATSAIPDEELFKLALVLNQEASDHAVQQSQDPTRFPLGGAGQMTRLSDDGLAGEKGPRKCFELSFAHACALSYSLPPRGYRPRSLR